MSSPESPRAIRRKLRLQPGKPRRRRRPAAGQALSRTEPKQGDDAPQRRLQQVLAAAGVGSRRHCEELITAGRVDVDGEVVTRLGTKVDPERQQVRLDGVALAAQRRSYFAVHKPVGVVSTNRDPSGRPRVVDLLPPSAGRVYTVGRLDLSSEGLILVTNDGELADRLTHPRYGVAKTYQVLVAGQISAEELARLERGVHLAEGFAKVEGARIKSARKQSSLLEIVLREGRNREIRRLLARAGHKVLRLKRIAIADLRLADLPSGAYRLLRSDEVRALRRATEVGRPAERTSHESLNDDGAGERESHAPPTAGGSRRRPGKRAPGAGKPRIERDKIRTRGRAKPSGAKQASGEQPGAQESSVPRKSGRAQGGRPAKFKPRGRRR